MPPGDDRSEAARPLDHRDRVRLWLQRCGPLQQSLQIEVRRFAAALSQTRVSGAQLKRVEFTRLPPVPPGRAPRSLPEPAYATHSSVPSRTGCAESVRTRPRSRATGIVQILVPRETKSTPRA